MSDWVQSHLQEGGILGAIALGLFVLVKWFAKRDMQRSENERSSERKRLDDHESRIRAMEANRVTHAHIDELRMSFMATITNAHSMLDKRMDDVRADIARLTAYLLERK